MWQFSTPFWGLFHDPEFLSSANCTVGQYCRRPINLAPELSSAFGFRGLVTRCFSLTTFHIKSESLAPSQVSVKPKIMLLSIFFRSVFSPSRFLWRLVQFRVGYFRLSWYSRKSLTAFSNFKGPGFTSMSPLLRSLNFEQSVSCRTMFFFRFFNEKASCCCHHECSIS